jgi:carboxymethylenebutenolidase
VYGSRDLYGRVMDTVHAESYKIAATVAYDGVYLPQDCPTLYHLAGSSHLSDIEFQSETNSRYLYPEATSDGFIVPGHPDYRHSSAVLAHTRTLTFVKKHLDGPFFDLEKIWEEHTEFEFANRSVARTMGTMVQEPYVNHISTVSAQQISNE